MFGRCSFFSFLSYIYFHMFLVCHVLFHFLYLFIFCVKQFHARRCQTLPDFARLCQILPDVQRLSETQTQTQSRTQTQTRIRPQTQTQEAAQETAKSRSGIYNRQINTRQMQPPSRIQSDTQLDIYNDKHISTHTHTNSFVLVGRKCSHVRVFCCHAPELNSMAI